MQIPYEVVTKQPEDIQYQYRNKGFVVRDAIVINDCKSPEFIQQHLHITRKLGVQLAPGHQSEPPAGKWQHTNIVSEFDAACKDPPVTQHYVILATSTKLQGLFTRMQAWLPSC
jgi:hypothetical protein